MPDAEAGKSSPSLSLKFFPTMKPDRYFDRSLSECCTPLYNTSGRAAAPGMSQRCRAKNIHAELEFCFYLQCSQLIKAARAARRKARQTSGHGELLRATAYCGGVALRERRRTGCTIVNVPVSPGGAPPSGTWGSGSDDQSSQQLVGRGNAGTPRNVLSIPRAAAVR